MPTKKKTKKKSTGKRTGGKAVVRLSGPPDAVGASPYDWLKDHCRGLAGTTEGVKWGAAHVFSVDTKMYAWFGLDGDGCSFQCDEEDFDLLTEREGIVPAPYAARMGWVKAGRGARLPRAEARGLLTKAHRIASGKLSKKRQRELGLIG